MPTKAVAREVLTELKAETDRWAAALTRHIDSVEKVERRDMVTASDLDMNELIETLDGIEDRAAMALVRVADKLVAEGADAATSKASKAIAEPFVDPKPIRRAVRRMARDSWEAGRAAIRREITGQVDMDAIAFEPPREAFDWLMAKVETVTGVLAEDLESTVRLAILESIKQGDTTQDAILRLREALEPWLGDPTRVDPVRAAELVTPSRLETIVRTNTTEAFNMGRLVELRRPQLDDVIEMVEYSAILDTRTTDICRYLSGRTFMKGDPDLDRLLPPNHHNCRSLLVPVPPSGEDDAREQLIDSEGKGRAFELAGRGFAKPKVQPRRGRSR